MVGVAYREIKADHVVRHRHAGVERRGPRMVAPLRAHPRDASRLGFFNRFFGGEFHHQMAHAVITVDERHARRFALNRDVRLDVDRAALDAADVLRQAENAVAFGAVHVGACHQLRDGLRFGFGNADGDKRRGDERFELRGT